jgi:hypothetical protein
MSAPIGHLRLVNRVVPGMLPAAPPPPAADSVAAAARRAAELAAADRELHFHKYAGTDRVVVQVRDLAGNVVRTISPSESLDIMLGLIEP